MAYQSELEKLERRWNENPGQYFAPFADQLRKAGEYERALEIVRAGLEARPGYVSGHIVLGRCLVDSGNLEEADGVFRQVVDLDAENIIALRQLAEISERSGDNAGAISWLEKLLEVDPMNEAASELSRLQEAPPEQQAPTTDAGMAEADAEAQAPPAVETDAVAGPGEVKPAAGFEPTSVFDQAVDLEPVATPGLEPHEPPTAEDLPDEAPEEVGPLETDSSVEEDLQIEPDFEHMAEEASKRPSVEGFAPEETLLGSVAEHGGEIGAVPGDDDAEPADDSDASQDVPVPIESLQPDSDAGEAEEEIEVADDDTLLDLAPGADGEDEAYLPSVGMAGDEDPTAMKELVERVSSVSEQPAGLPEEDAFPEEPQWISADETSDDGEQGLVATVPEGGRTSPEEDEEDDEADDEATLPLITPPEEVEAARADSTEDDSEDSVDEPDLVVTETMASVYESQGLLGQAREVYVRLLERRPGDSGLEAKLAALDERASRYATDGSKSASRTGGESARDRLRRLLGIAEKAEAATESAPTESTTEAATSVAAPEEPNASESFDDFYGDSAGQPRADEGESDSKSDEGESDEAFRQWLRGLKSE